MWEKSLTRKRVLVGILLLVAFLVGSSHRIRAKHKDFFGMKALNYLVDNFLCISWQ